MIIYFEDGPLRNTSELPVKPDYSIDAGCGITYCLKRLEYILAIDEAIGLKSVIYTNSIASFSNTYSWDESLRVPEIYIRSGDYSIFTRIDELTDRELRQGMNLAKLYIAGEFE